MKHPTLFHRADYRPPAYFIDSTALEFDLDPKRTIVKNTLKVRRNPSYSNTSPLELDGEQLEFIHLTLNGQPHQGVEIQDNRLVLTNLPDEFELMIENACFPEKNTALTGLYLSKNQFFTQCEAQGFRHITYFLDRPDVMSTYTVTLRAHKKSYPILLSNGNLIAEGDLEEDRHFAQWQDPFKKPCYLFALVAGHLVKHEQFIETQAGKKQLQIWVEQADLNKIDFAMQSLIAAIRWDEQRFGLSLDLERFMIVAVSDFNMGAMENKGLNLFNTKYVLATPQTATDQDFLGVESVIGHEYFHNWTGNRVTCRDWFQLSLKEGLTVFRDQEFSIDQAIQSTQNEVERGVYRIRDVISLREHQFPEDAGPMAHPVRPESYMEIDNFYTMTVYEKGAEVVRMYQTLLGQTGFKKGLDLYFKRHDGQAVTCDDFRLAMADANQIDLSQFENWYSQSGTPIIVVNTEYHEQHARFTIHLTQISNHAQAFFIPFAIGLLDENGHDLPLQLEGEYGPPETTKILKFDQKEQSFQFKHIPCNATASLLRNFSAPVIIQYEQSDETLAFLFKHDSDPFNRWEAGQQYMSRIVHQQLETGQNTLPELFIDAFEQVLNDPSVTPAFKALALNLPSEAYLIDSITQADPLIIHEVRQRFKQTLANHLHASWFACYQAHTFDETYHPSPEQIGKRALKNLALQYLVFQDQPHLGVQLAQTQYQTANNMTDRLHALTALLHATEKLGDEIAQSALDDFYQRFENDDLVIDKWFALQASQAHSLQRVQVLQNHPAFNAHNPNRFRSLVFAFCMQNLSQLHQKDGSGYTFWAEHVLKMDQINPQMAARLTRILENWSKFAQPYRGLIQHHFQQIAQHAQSANLLEIVEKALQTRAHHALID